MNTILRVLLVSCLLVVGAGPSANQTIADKDFEELMRAIMLPSYLDLRDQNLYLQLAVGPCGNPCTVEKNFGGKVWLFKDAASDVLKSERNLLVINGECASACAILADFARPQVCIAENAYFEFHQAYIRLKKRTKYTGPQPQSKDIDRWVRLQPRGYPKKSFTKMPFTVAKRFWPVCELHPPLPHPDPRGKITATAE